MTSTPRTNVSELLAEAAERTPDAPALVEHRPTGADGAVERRERTWAQVDADAVAVARALSGAGLRAGHRVAVVMANRIDLVVAYFAVLRGGMVAVPVNPRSTPREIGRMLADSGARVVLCDEAAAAQVREAVADLATDGGERVRVVVDGVPPEGDEMSFEQLLHDAPTAEPAAPRDPEAPAVILYTSGTSGKPRGAVLTHRALLANVEQTAAVEPSVVDADDVVLGLLPMFHIYGLNAVLGQAVRQGARVVLVDGFDPTGLLRTISSEGVTNVALAPPVVAAWAGRDDLREHLAGVKHVLCGAAALDPDLAAEFTASSGHVVEQGYGLTETAPVITATLASGREPDVPPVPGSVGHPLPGIELRLVDSATGVQAAPGDPAEVWVRGDNLFSGYWPDGADGPRPDGWYPTGDIGYLDDEGDLVLVDRVRELVIVSGFNVYPAEVEHVVAEVEGVGEVAVVGVPDEDTGEAVLAFVVPTGSADAGTLETAVVEHCSTRLARFKQPRHVLVVENLPHSATGKVAKGRLRALARSQDLGLQAR